MHLQPEFAQEVTDILMEDERLFYTKANIPIYRSMTILTLRWYLVGKIIEEKKKLHNI
jgi:DNA primase